MNIHIKTTNIDLTEAISSYVDKKYLSLEKLIPGDTTDLPVYVEIGKTTNHHQTGDIFRAEVQFHIKGKDIRAEEERSDLFAAIDDVRDEIDRILSSHKDKKATVWKRGAQRIKDIIRGLRQ